MAEEVPGCMENVYCQPCSTNNVEKSAAKYCQDCEEYQCDDCVKAHRLFPVTKSHSLLDLCEIGQTLLKCNLKDLDQCKQHDRRLEFFCEDDNKLCCSKCVVIRHKNCSRVEDIETIAGRTQTNWTSMQQGLTDIATNAKKIVEHVKNQRTALAVGSTDVQSKIETMQDKVNQLFDNLKKTACIEVESFQRKILKTLDKMETTCQTVLAKVEETRSGIINCSQLDKAVQQFIFARHVSVLTADLGKSIDVLNEEMKEVRLSYEFEDTLKLPPTDEPFWKLSLCFEKRNENIQSDSTGRESESIDHEICDQNTQLICQLENRTKELKKISLKCIASLDLKQKDDDSAEPLYCGVDFLPDGRLVAADFLNKKCVLYDQQLEHISHLPLSYAPFDVAVLSTTDIIITSGCHKKLYTYKIEKSSSIVEAKCINVSVNCDSISVVDAHTVCVGTFYNEDYQVLFLSLKSGWRKLLSLLWTVYYGINYRYQFPTGCYSIDYHSCAYIQNIAKIVFTDRSTDTVYIQDIATNQLVTVNDEVIKGPRRVTGGPDDTIFILCSENNSLVHITKTGQVLGLHSIDVDGIFNICSSLDRRKLAVSNSCLGKTNCTIYEISEV